MPKLLLIDDEPNVLYSLQSGLETDDLTVCTAPAARPGIELVEQERPDAVVLDVRLPDMSGLDAFDRIREIDSRLPVIIITAFASTATAIEAMKRGAFEYLLKPVGLHQMREVVAKALELRRMQTVPTLIDPEPDTTTPADPIIGRSPAMQEVYKAIGRFAPQNVTVLIQGESGTGKELVARAIYQHSRRSEQPFSAINCAAIPEPLLESELFGHEKGSFTGADRQRIGKFEQANGGTLFLDEIGDMTPTTQAKVLRLLQEQRFERVGGTETISTNVRVIAATNQDLDAMVRAHRFRQDLLYRLNGCTVYLPPLRNRADDVPLLVEQFVKQANQTLGKQVRSVVPDAIRILERHPWPGNVRELQNVVRYAVIQAVGEIITVESLPANLRGHVVNTTLTPTSHGLVEMVQQLLNSGSNDIYRQMLQYVDKIVLDEVLHHVKGNQVHASVLLGISRTTLRSKLAHKPDENEQ